MGGGLAQRYVPLNVIGKMKMKKFITIILVLSMCLYFYDCTKDDINIHGTHRYIAHDSTGITIVTGHLSISFEDSSNLSGEWELEQIGNPENIGPQTGNGTLIGGINQDTIWINLNPNYMDNNVQLNGILQNGGFNGEWISIGYPGILNKGSFTAEEL